MKVEQEAEIQVLEKLKAKMDRIKATQQKLLETAKEPAHHAKGRCFRPNAFSFLALTFVHFKLFV